MVFLYYYYCLPDSLISMYKILSQYFTPISIVLHFLLSLPSFSSANLFAAQIGSPLIFLQNLTCIQLMIFSLLLILFLLHSKSQIQNQFYNNLQYICLYQDLLREVLPNLSLCLSFFDYSTPVFSKKYSQMNTYIFYINFRPIIFHLLIAIIFPLP